MASGLAWLTAGLIECLTAISEQNKAILARLTPDPTLATALRQPVLSSVFKK